MKVHEETWTAKPTPGWVEDVHGCVIADVMSCERADGALNDMAERTQLLSAAPDMARALVEFVQGAESSDLRFIAPGALSMARAALKKAGIL